MSKKCLSRSDGNLELQTQKQLEDTMVSENTSNMTGTSKINGPLTRLFSLHFFQDYFKMVKALPHLYKNCETYYRSN